LLVSALAYAPYEALTTSELKAPGDLIYLVGGSTPSLVASEFAEIFEIPGAHELETSSLSAHRQLYRRLHECMKARLVRSAHDISEGGLLVALAEKLIGATSGFGARVDLPPGPA